MPVLRTYQCPDCEGFFEHYHPSSSDPPPDNCGICGKFMGEGVEPELPQIHLGGSAISRSVDQTYRAVESLGQTDMKDGLRQGDQAGVPVQNNLTRDQRTVGVAPSFGGMGGSSAPAHVQSLVAAGKRAVNGEKTTGAVAISAIQAVHGKAGPRRAPQLMQGRDRRWGG